MPFILLRHTSQVRLARPFHNTSRPSVVRSYLVDIASREFVLFTTYCVCFVWAFLFVSIHLVYYLIILL